MSTAAASAAAATEPVVAPLFVDIVSDVVCPWCYIGKRKLEAALATLRREPGLVITVRWHPFELNPDLPAQGMPRAAYIEAKFGGKTPADAIYERVRTVGAEAGIVFAFDRIRLQPNTLDAHRLIAWAQQRGDAEVLVERLFRAFFTEGRNLGAIDELVALAADTGLPADETRAMLVSAAYRAEVKAECREAQESGITGVPFFIFNGRAAVSGAHDPATLLEAIAAARASA
ncbi:MAG TPA: DsbA family oxidoreductase [Casimicrobiaceae bacterium]|jgi:predicted DsbA family dithiol-disulfide isomerase|nr:DsbA family oxidoreductase [Casimicrobiaceae bacterium]